MPDNQLVWVSYLNLKACRSRGHSSGRGVGGKLSTNRGVWGGGAPATQIYIYILFHFLSKYFRKNCWRFFFIGCIELNFRWFLITWNLIQYIRGKKIVKQNVVEKIVLRTILSIFFSFPENLLICMKYKKLWIFFF